MIDKSKPVDILITTTSLRGDGLLGRSMRISFSPKFHEAKEKVSLFFILIVPGKYSIQKIYTRIEGLSPKEP